jgi:glycosyltransferase involved in cell wall biosynthesis
VKVLLACMDFPPNVGGVAAHAFELGRALVRLGHEVRVASLRLPPEAAAVEVLDGMDVRRGDAGPRWRWRGRLRRLMADAVAEFHPDVIHVHGLRPLRPSRGLGVPVVFTNHTSGFLMRVERGPFQARRLGRMMAHAAITIAPSHELQEASVRAGFPRDRTVYIPNGVDAARFRPDVDGAPARAALGIRPNALVVLAARRMVPKNGVRYLAAAAKGFVKDGVVLLLVGDGEERPLIERTLADDGVADRAILAGSRGNAEMPGFYAASDVVVLPSLREATSIAGLEAMATGKPLVGTRVGGIPELIEDGRTGLLVPPADPDALAAAIRRLLDDPDLRKKAGDLGRLRVLERFSWDVVAARTVDAYREAL